MRKKSEAANRAAKTEEEEKKVDLQVDGESPPVDRSKLTFFGALWLHSKICFFRPRICVCMHISTMIFITIYGLRIKVVFAVH